MSFSFYIAIILKLLFLCRKKKCILTKLYDSSNFRLGRYRDELQYQSKTVRSRKYKNALVDARRFDLGTGCEQKRKLSFE